MVSIPGLVPRSKISAAEKDNTPATELPGPPKTTGEKFYDGLQFTVGKVAIIVATALLANVAKYGKEAYGPVPNYLKKFQGWFHTKLLTNKIYPLAEKGEMATRLAGAAANTMVTFHGGNAFAPIMKGMENNHENIANAINRNCGKPGEEEVAHERLKDKPHQNWSDIFKGRVAAWAVVFTAFMGADALIGKSKKTGMYHFDQYEEWFGRRFAGYSKGGRELAKIPVTQALTKEQDANKMYRFGKILALDVYATSAALMVWNFVSRLSAEKRQDKKEEAEAVAIAAPAPEPVAEAPVFDQRESYLDLIKSQGSIREDATDISHIGKLAAKRQLPTREASPA